MLKPRYNEAGETLIEMIFALVIIGLVVSALFSSFTTASTASGRTRDLTTVDATLRNAAEAVKTAVRSGCASGSTYSVTFTAAPGYNAPTNISNAACPAKVGAANSTLPVTLTVNAPNGAPKTLKIVVRSP